MNEADRIEDPITRALFDCGCVVTETEVQDLIHVFKQELSQKWTKEKPTEPGWYWVISISGKREVGQIRQEKTDRIYFSFAYLEIKDTKGFRFAGPIPEPPKGE